MDNFNQGKQNKNNWIKDVFNHMIKNIELYIIIGVGIALTVLSFFDKVSFNTLAKGILLIITFLAFSLLRTRTAIQNLDETAKRLAEKELSSLSTKMEQLIELHHPDLRMFDTHKSAMTRLEMISRAKKRVRILSTNLFSFFYTEADLYELFQTKLKSGCKFQIIIYMPDSPGIKEKQWEENDLTLQRDIFSSWERYLGPATQKFPEGLEIKFININPSFAATIIDDEFMFVSLNVPGGSRRNRQTPRFEIESTHSLFKIFTAAFEKIWKDRVYVTSSPPKQLESLLRNE